MPDEGYNIRVGIKTSGSPIIKEADGYTLVENMLIGDGFHWQQTIEAKLPGEIELYEEGRNEELNSDKDRNLNDHVRLINTLPLETYLECVVGSEMNPEAPLEFLKAHAVISRSWALGKVLGLHHENKDGKIDMPERLVGWDDTSEHKNFHVCSDDHCQRYQGIQPISDIALRAIKETEGEVLTTPSGKLLDCRFSKCCGGRTEIFSTCWQPVEEECLESFEDPWCNLSSMLPSSRRILLSTILKDYDQNTVGYGFDWKIEVAKKDIQKRLKERFGRDIGKIRDLEILHRGPSGRIDLLRIKGSESSLEIGKELWIRRFLSPTHLYSSAFTIEDKGEKIILDGKGWGHGVGLCQIGAANMAYHGINYKDILAFYYPKSQLTRNFY